MARRHNSSPRPSCGKPTYAWGRRSLDYFLSILRSDMHSRGHSADNIRHFFPLLSSPQEDKGSAREIDRSYSVDLDA